MEIIRIGDSAPEPLPAGERPLSGVRVLDLTRVLAGPTCARTLAEHGADVLKITAAHLPSLGYQELRHRHGKLSAHLDLREPANVEILRGLVRKADVFSQGYRPGTLGRSRLVARGAGAIAAGHRLRLALRLRPRRPVGVAARLRHGGADGQRHHATSRRSGPREVAGTAVLSGVGDRLLTGYLMAFGAMVALARRAREGGSWLVRISLAQVGKWIVDRGEVPAAALAGRTGRVHRRRAGTLVDGQRDAVRPAPPSQAGGAVVRNPAVLGAARGAARVSPPRVAVNTESRAICDRRQRLEAPRTIVAPIRRFCERGAVLICVDPSGPGASS